MASLFHKFIEVSAAKPLQTAYFPQFIYMQQEIRKSYKQVKGNNKGLQKPSEDFVEYWKEIGNIGRQQQVTVYFKWIELLSKALLNYLPHQLAPREGDLYVKKSLLHKWDVRKVKLNGLVMQIFSKRLKQFPLKCFAIRKSKNKDHFSWVMEVVMQVEGSKYKLKSFHMGSNNVNQYQDWYRDIQERIDIARVEYFKGIVDYEGKFGTVPKEGMKQEIKKQVQASSSENRCRVKTLTQLAIDKELKHIDQLEGINETQQKEKVITEKHPNIFVRMFPDKDLTGFCQNPTNGTLLECQKQYRLYQTQGTIKIFITFNRNMSVVFRAISQSHKNWNPEIDVFNIKNKISSQNSLFVYQKDKAKGFLYRDRDYFFLRHCFIVETEGNKERSFMIQRSIDSIHQPPFMTVARGEKQLIWCVMGNHTQKECLLIVEGVIRGGGYMNATEDKDNTIKYFKKLLQLDNYLKQIQLAKPSQDGCLFNEKWLVSLKEEDDEFYSPNEIASGQFQGQQIQGNKKKASQDSVYYSPREADESVYQQFIQQTAVQIQNSEKEPVPSQSQQSKNTTSVDQINDDYVPPEFNSQDKSVIIPQTYLTKTHRIEPKPKGKPIFVQPYRGHHLWKGQWAVAQTGGLNYVDQEKMRQQKKVLTFIIKRIGKNIFSGKGILNISLPVDIFCRESNIERLAMSFGYCPLYLQKVLQADPIEQLKAVMASIMGSSLIYLTMQKPFNPILGETYQCWIDGCPVYFEQISHHPPVASYLMKGRGYEVYGSVEAKMQLSINSGTGINEGLFTVKFDSGRKFHFTTPPGELTGLTYGERKLCLVDKTYYWSLDEGIFVELTYNPQSKQSRFFSNSKTYVGEEKLADYFEGIVKKYKPEDLLEHLSIKKKDSNTRTLLIPKSAPPQEPLKELGKVYGRWTKEVYFNNEKIFDTNASVHFKGYDEKNPLPSHSNFREDVVYRRLNEFVLSQQWKEILQVRQRKDRKLREDWAKKRK